MERIFPVKNVRERGWLFSNQVDTVSETSYSCDSVGRGV